MARGYRQIEHTADVGIEAYGDSLKQAYVNAAKGLFSLIIDLRHVKIKTAKEINVTADSQEDLLVSWLNELIYIFDTEYLVLRKFNISHIDSNRLHATVYGEKIDPNLHQIKIGVKATTYHMLRINNEDGYRVRVIFDV
jgi:SHS2 domain-containing protein